MERESLVKPGGNYFASAEKPNIEFISSGCKLLDCALGGGYPLGRMVNIVGDRSTGKTLLAIEACANFHAKYPTCKIWYRETEAAFDEDYAEALGMPVNAIDFGKDEKNNKRLFHTVEEIFEDLEVCLEECKKSKGLYIIDSLDALSDKAEQGRKIGEGSFGANKPKKISELFRRLNQKIEQSNITIMIVSQVRDNIGVSFGEKQTRSGGKALDFYASQIVWLANLGQIKKQKNKISRTYGVKVRAKIKKNKVGLPFREAEFPIIFGFGVDDLIASLDWLKSVGRIEDTGIDEAAVTKFLKDPLDIDEDLYEEMRQKAIAPIPAIWSEIEEGFLPRRKKRY